jgi:ArsR family transcriptional regulator
MSSLPLVQSCTPLARPTLSDAQAAELEQVFKALADRHRVKLLNLLARAGDQAVCVCDLVETLQLKQPAVSYHLKQLVDAGLITRQRRGTYSYYRLAPGALRGVAALLAEQPELAQAGRPD